MYYFLTVFLGAAFAFAFIFALGLGFTFDLILVVTALPGVCSG